MTSAQQSPTPLKSLLVIGGCGFLGHHLVRILQKYHPETTISVLDLRTNVNRFPGVTYYDGDITSRESVSNVLAREKPETVIDTVSPIHGLGKDVYFKVNVEGTRTCMEASRDAGVKAFVWTSSASVLFDGESDVVNLNEKAPIPKKALDPYTETKVCLPSPPPTRIQLTPYRQSARKWFSKPIAKAACSPAPCDYPVSSVRATASSSQACSK